MDLIKKDLMGVVKQFEVGALNLERLNYVIITLIPKKREASHLKKFRPISMLNCRFKIFGKALNNRLSKVIDRLVAFNQTTFIKDRFISESVVPTHEIIHDVTRNKEAGVILKLDYDKAYDRARWEFLEEMLRSRGFSSK